MPEPPAGPTQRVIESLYSAEWVRLVANLARHTGDLGLAEDAVQEAFEAAFSAWTATGAPDNPAAWLWVTARRRALDQLRRRQNLARKTALLGNGPLSDSTDGEHWDVTPTSALLRDDVLGLFFACCHPALAPEARIALTLRAVGGLTPDEIAYAFVVPRRTLDQRLVRARRKIRDAAIPMTIPPDHELPERLGSVLRVVYLIFNEGYSASTGDQLVRPDLVAEACRLGRMLMVLMPDEPEVIGLVALMTLHEGRRPARIDAAGNLVPLEDQDRSLWNQQLIADGTRLLDRALRGRRPGPYQTQAAIAALHAGAAHADETDWAQVAALYQVLMTWEPTPVVALNRAVAIAMACGPDAGLAQLPPLEADDSLASYYLLPATRADLERRAGRFQAAATSYRRSLELATNPVERAYLARRMAELTRGEEASLPHAQAGSNR
jgi:RNA polymerase sigma-70 factor (ECF subfamily)